MKRKKRIPYIAQLGRTDCGIACLTMIFNYYGFKADIVDIGNMACIGRDGMTLAQMKDIAEKYGFKFNAYRYAYEQNNLRRMLPVILCNDSHYIVVEKVKRNDKYVVIDPAEGRKILGFSELQNMYKDILVSVMPGSNAKIIKKSPIKLQVKKNGLILSAFLLLVSQFITLCVPFIVQRVIDGLSNNIQINLYKILAIIFLIMISYFLVCWIRQVLLLNVNTDLFKRMISSMLQKLFRLDISFFEWHTAGEIGNRFNSINQLNDIITNGLANVLIQGITSLVCFFVMIYISPRLTVFILVMALMEIVIMIVLNRKNLSKTREYIYSQSNLQGDLIDTLGNIVEIKCMGMDREVCVNLQNSYADLIMKFNQKTKVSNLMSCFISMIGLVIPLATYLIGSFSVRDGSLSVGILIAFVTLVGYFTAPFMTIVMMLPSINSVREVLLRYKELMSFRESAHDGIVMEGDFRSIKIRNMSYRYNSSCSYALDDVTLVIEKGMRIAIVGLSGSGKSTLIKALLGAVEINKGNIFLNDNDINEISREQIYKWFSIVTQNPMCLNASIRKNVDITGDFSDDDIWKALEIAELKDEIKNMPLGLDTIVGEGGQNISGGQKQRLAIARAMINEKEVIIFDEATSNLDQITEKKIYENLKATNKMQIIITHRLSSIRDVDQIYVLNKGKVIERGTHESLMKKQGWYYDSVR